MQSAISGERSFSPSDALPVDRFKCFGCKHQRFRHCDSRPKLLIREMPDRRAADDNVPRGSKRSVEADAHEAMILRYGPAMLFHHSRKDVADQFQPTRDQHGAAARSAIRKRQDGLLVWHCGGFRYLRFYPHQHRQRQWPCAVKSPVRCLRIGLSQAPCMMFPSQRIYSALRGLWWAHYRRRRVAHALRWPWPWALPATASSRWRASPWSPPCSSA
jgi:hypothetical protein